MEQKIKKLKIIEIPAQFYTPKISDLNINLKFIGDIIEKLSEFNKHKIKFFEQYLIFLELHNNLLNNGIAKIEVRSVTYRQNFILNYDECSLNQSDELHHIFGNRSSNKSEEIVTFNKETHKYYHSVLDNLNIFYKNLIKKFKIIEDIENNINFVKLKYNDIKNITFLVQEIKELMNYIYINGENYRNIKIIPDKLIEEQLRIQTNILWKQFYTLSDKEIIDEELKKLNNAIKSVNIEIENYIKKDGLENIIRNLNIKYLKESKNKSKKQDNIITIYEKVINAINENKITKQDIGNTILIEIIGCGKQLERTNEKNKMNGINNKIKKLEQIRINLNELFDYKTQLLNRLDNLNSLKNNKAYELADNIRMEKMNKISIIDNYIDSIIKYRKENQQFLIDSINSSEFLNTLQEINDCFDGIIKQNNMKNIA